METFVDFLSIAVSIIRDVEARYRLHRILSVIIRRPQCPWTVTVRMFCRVLVNFGSSLSDLLVNTNLVRFTVDDLRYVNIVLHSLLFFGSFALLLFTCVELAILN